MYSNFDFMERIDQDLYDKLVAAEKVLYTSKKATGEALRNFWELFSSKLISKYGIYDTIEDYLGGKAPDLAACLAFLTQPPKGSNPADKFASYNAVLVKLNQERAQRGQEIIRFFVDKNIPAEFTPKYSAQSHSRYFDKKRNTQRPISLMWFFRQYCNDCKHEPVDHKPPVFDVSFAQTLDYLTQLHKFLLSYYNIQADKYNDIIILLSKFEITKVDSSPNDNYRSHCFKECAARYYPTTGYAKNFPAIIRFFRKGDLDANFASRSASVNSLVDKNACGKGLRQIIELADFNSDAEFYIIAYVFENEPMPLSSDLLQDTPYSTRLEWCREIAWIINNLHTNDPKIFHRMLNHNCIYLTKGKGDSSQQSPSLIKLSFAKISDDNAPTVFDNAVNAVNVTLHRQSAEPKYIAPEFCNRPEADAVELHWERTDVFSLGMLISDILCGNISQHPHTVAELKIAGVDQRIIEIIARCLGIAANRPTAAQVLSVLQNI